MFGGGGGFGAFGGLGALYNPAAYGTASPVTETTGSLIGQDPHQQLLQKLPQYMDMVTEASGDIMSNLQGQVPQDVWEQLQNRAAERGIAGGVPGSANANASLMRALGLTSLDLQTLGNRQLTEAMGRTPIQRTETTEGTSRITGGPDPFAAAMANLAALQLGMGAGGGAGGGFGGVSGGAPWGPPFAPPTGPPQVGPFYGTTPGGATVPPGPGFRYTQPGLSPGAWGDLFDENWWADQYGLDLGGSPGADQSGLFQNDYWNWGGQPTEFGGWPVPDSSQGLTDLWNTNYAGAPMPYQDFNWLAENQGNVFGGMNEPSWYSGEFEPAGSDAYSDDMWGSSEWGVMPW